ncbi:hypothetical protein LEP1GSC062_0018 [Leptospira alexanderi serovar Manhao 3 str. L 60]|uniref:Uncharacterized protein n=1 Tax=Leptospira alexanderi serovar Manhao 3 str. L 60 TaxID=1049759 RepID=V6HWB1_9LEPT|nr:hypothetical protein LEP1GSC062_0018 [Leptospira alexanderi serovar Manhao 3 str. L 60]
MKSCKELSSFFILKRVSIPFEDNFMFVGVFLFPFFESRNNGDCLISCIYLCI